LEQPLDEVNNPADPESFGPTFGPEPDFVEIALAKAIEGATAARRWDVVAQLARELEARRLGRAANVVDLATVSRRQER
jgi:hypothetical protein